MQSCAITLTYLPCKKKVVDHGEENAEVITDTMCVLCNLECKDAFSLKEHIVSHIGSTSTLPVNKLENDDRGSSNYQVEVPLISIVDKTIDHDDSIIDQQKNTINSNANASFEKVRHIECWLDNPRVDKKHYYSCTLCGTERFTFSNLTTHIKKKCLLPEFQIMEHEKDDTETRKVSCKKPRSEITRLYNKSPKERKKALLKCPKCEKTFVYFSTLKLHMKTHQSRSKFLCITCGRSYLNQSSLLEHTKSHADEPAVCTFCGVTYRNAIMLKAHMTSHTGTYPHQCDRCDEGFLFENDLKKHLKHEHDYVQRDFQCPTCKKMFTTIVRLSLHQSAYCKEHNESVSSARRKTTTHSIMPQSTWLCSYCGKSFGSRTTMVAHEKSVHVSNMPTSQIQQQTCLICSKVFPYRNQFRRHMKWHQGSKKLTCDICGCICDSGASLRLHMITHSDQRPFVCLCGSSFKRASQLRCHKKSVHNMILPALTTKPRQFSCYICGETFEGRKEQTQHTELYHPTE